ncbi:MAG: D-amino-acid transaminase [Alphaproteobacteria bacterium]|nr:D-amino-acid transaminase [Alphaproteobacteria bacterium]MCB9928268.1 D-amino-acid transaminase [Alphaproteobacteria bacterium]
MSRVAYVNGRYCPHAEARVSVEDRGFQFADGVYEVIAIDRGRFVDELPHLDRWDRSLGALRLPPAMPRAALRRVMAEVMRRNRVREGIVYLQLTRGQARRDAPFPRRATPTLVMTCRRQGLPSEAQVQTGTAVLSVPEIRWQRCDVKSVALLPNVLAKQKAREHGAFEAWFTRESDGVVTEGGSTNAFIVDGEGRLVTHPATNAILGGITRDRVLSIARAAGMTVEERPFTLAEAKGAREAFMTSTTTGVYPIVRIDDDAVANGRPGSLSLALAGHYRTFSATGAMPS